MFPTRDAECRVLAGFKSGIARKCTAEPPGEICSHLNNNHILGLPQRVAIYPYFMVPEHLDLR